MPGWSGGALGLDNRKQRPRQVGYLRLKLGSGLLKLLNLLLGMAHKAGEQMRRWSVQCRLPAASLAMWRTPSA
ncbi:MAG: hypothetical protein HC893_16195 [Chloroflexaceae bacterium]|nr:hypothetical protein [Chloroflexaceae bacterium]